MKKALVLFVLLTGCASEPTKEEQDAAVKEILRHYAIKCLDTGIDPKNRDAVYSCMGREIRADQAKWNAAQSRSQSARFGEALRGMAGVLQSQPMPRQPTTCTTSRGGFGSLTTICD